LSPAQKEEEKNLFKSVNREVVSHDIRQTVAKRTKNLRTGDITTRKTEERPVLIGKEGIRKGVPNLECGSEQRGKYKAKSEGPLGGRPGV